MNELATLRTIIHYDEDTDDFIISNKNENEVVKNNFMFDDFTISLTGSGKIVGLEIRNASHFLEESGLDKNLLKKVKSAELRVIPKKDFIYIGIIFLFEENKQIIERKVPITYLPIRAIAS